MSRESLSLRRLAMVRRFRESGLSARAFASREGISTGTLRLWRNRAERTESESSPFIPVRLVEPRDPQPTALATIELAGGRRLCVPHGFDAEQIIKLVGALESC